MPAPISIVIPTYNRARLVCNAIDAALAFLAAYGPGEIIVVDDASRDGTQDQLAARYAGEIAARQVRLHIFPVNRGVCGAKNAGAAAARYGWLVFADSDDMLDPAAALGVSAVLAAADNAPAVFFRCLDVDSGLLIGAPLAAPILVDGRMLGRGWLFGDCLPIVRTSAARRFPYPEQLRGFEGLAYLRMARHLGPVLLSPLSAHRVLRSGTDRVTSEQRRRSACRRARGYVQLLSEFPVEHGLKRGVRVAAAAARATVDCALHRLGFS